ncbi:MAG TPA: DJ-1/PfpI family protein, partial [Candidatus Baltobacteraceae bacterium]|nr:DJ-1/PfpI family protein [Candidatus Baltobacteraceae bacterium]
MPRVVFPIVDRFEIFDLAGPLQVLHEANLLGARYDLMFAGLDRSVESQQRVTLAKLRALPSMGPEDLAIVPGSAVLRETRQVTKYAPLATWLRKAYETGATISSVCVGAFLLGRAGLLDGRACTTHWKHTDELARRFPRARVLNDRLFVFDDRVMTSAGIAAGVDMTLAFVELHHGAKMAASIAREMVVHVRRSGADSQLNPLLGYRDHLEGGVHAVQDRIISEPTERHSLNDLAQIAGVSRRHLTRLFRAATGISVAEYHNAIRL